MALLICIVNKRHPTSIGALGGCGFARFSTKVRVGASGFQVLWKGGTTEDIQIKLYTFVFVQTFV